MQQQSQIVINSKSTITLQDILEIDNSYPQNLISNNQFAVYQSSSNSNSQIQVPFITIDTSKMPKIPMRRISCIDCLNKNLQCQNCSKCKRNKCCRNISCIYDFQEWKRKRQNKCYKKCNCFQYLSNNDQFSIDWRLMAMIQKIPYQIIKKSVPLYLSKARNCLWINDLQSSNNTSKINYIFYQDNFTTNNYFQKSIKTSNPQSIKAIVKNNSRHLQNIFTINIRNYLTKKQNWDLSNLQKQCQEITDEFLKDKKIEKVINQLFKSSEAQIAYSNMPSLKYEGKYTQNISKDSKILQGNKYSRQINENILFYFCRNTMVIFIKNAKFYAQDNEYANLRPIKIQFIRKNLNYPNFHWFKDKIGDIFAIYEDSLYIFKYDLDKKCYVMMYLYTHRCLLMVESSNSLLYVGQRDFVYYFHSKDLKKSFYFSLNRPKVTEKQSKQGSNPLKISCNQVSLYETAFEKIGLSITTTNLKSTYIIEDKIDNKQFRSYIPIIYLFFQRKSYEPYGIGVLTITHMDSIQCKQIITNEIQGRRGKLNNVGLDKSLLFTVRRHKYPCFYMYTLNNDVKVLIGVKIQSKNQKNSLKWWQQTSNLCISNDTKFHLKKSSKEQKNYYQPHSYLIIPSSNNNTSNRSIFQCSVQYNDFAGLPSNNQYRLLTLNAKTSKIEQIVINFIQGDSQWLINDQQ